jgi:hypothetical protein
MPSLCADLSKIASQGTLIENADGAVYLCSLFKLLQATEKATSNDGLDDIDGLLGCGITMFKQEYLEVRPLQKGCEQFYPIHPNQTGNLIYALSMISAIGYF